MMDKLTKETLIHKYNTKVESAYCIVVKENELSEKMATRCIQTCNKVNMPVKRWEAFDGTKGEIIVPEHLRDRQWLKWLKVVNEALALTEICCALSHFSLWAHCIELDQPIVVLEHDAIMIQKFEDHPAFNAFIYLGSEEQVANNYWGSIPIHGQLNQNYRFMLRTHSYSVDPMMCKKLMGNLIKDGITTSIDVMLRTDLYANHQFGIFAFDFSEGQSICPEKDYKKQDDRLTKINNKIT
jgi:hypothetical protein